MPNQSFSDMCTRANSVREGKIEESGSSGGKEAKAETLMTRDKKQMFAAEKKYIFFQQLSTAAGNKQQQQQLFLQQQLRSRSLPARMNCCSTAKRKSTAETFKGLLGARPQVWDRFRLGFRSSA